MKKSIRKTSLKLKGFKRTGNDIFVSVLVHVFSFASRILRIIFSSNRDGLKFNKMSTLRVYIRTNTTASGNRESYVLYS